MHGFFRLSAALTGALVLSGQAGCALTPESAGTGVAAGTGSRVPEDNRVRIR
jgi:hypothetical protein